MKYLAGLPLLLLVVASSHAEDFVHSTSANSELDAQHATAKAAIHKNAVLFVESFNKTDAKAIAELFTESAEYVTADGRTLRGRSEIENDFAGLFAENRNLQIGMAIDSLRVLGSNVAIEDGRTWSLHAPVGSPSISRYTATHTIENGRWLVASVRENVEEIPSNYEHLKELEWMIGSWTAEAHGTKTVMTSEWISNKNFVKRTYTASRDGEVISSGTHIIGWDPSTQQITAWMFDSGGGHGRAVFAHQAGQVVIQTSAILPDGSHASATNTITPIDENHFTWNSINRSLNGELLADIEPVTVIRSTAISANLR